MATGRPILGAFNQGEIPKIACFNKATIPLGVDFDDLIAAMQEYVDKFQTDLQTRSQFSPNTPRTACSE